jgi:SAM-dependent methyltransferase
MPELQSQYRDSTNLNARSAIYRFGTGRGFGPGRILDLMLETIPVDAAILEVGCGPGWMWRSNLDRVPQSWRMLLTDLTPGMTEEATAAFSSDARFSVRQMDVQTLDLPDDHFDAVIANWMLYHVEDRARALAEIRRVLKSGGLLLAATNGDAHLATVDALVNEYLGDASPAKGGLAFTLENGQSQLGPFFSDIALHQGHNVLNITEAEVVVRYVLSFNEAKQTVVGDRLEELRRRVGDEIRVAGAFVAQVHSGLFVAKKA